MAFLLDSENVFAYLACAGLWPEGQPCDLLSAQSGKNFSLRIKGGDLDLLVKQETHGLKGTSSGEIRREEGFYQLLEVSPDLETLRSRIIYPLHFDAENSIIVFPFLDNVCDLSSFYKGFSKELVAGDAKAPGENRNEAKSLSSDEVNRSKADRKLPTAIAASLGENFAKLHSSTFQKKSCENFAREKHWAEWFRRGRGKAIRAQSGNPASEQSNDKTNDQMTAKAKAEAVRTPTFLAGLSRITPEIFCVIPTDALKFFRFYQRYPEIGEAIEGLNHSFTPDCVVHDDPRFANFLLHNFQSFQLFQSLSVYPERVPESVPESVPEKVTVQLIDWEKWNWGDPAYDLGQLVANYLQLWLKSLPVSANLDLATTLSRAKLPLVAVQPSIAALLQAYFETFPQILFHRPDFLLQLMRFTGLALIRQVQIYIAQKHPLGNVEMAMVQVAKSLLCQPEASIPTVFGQSRSDLELSTMQESTQAVKGR